jgi:hypothetical protein
MKNLTDMLSEHNIGVPIASQIINAYTPGYIVFVFICFFNICIPNYPFIRFINTFSYLLPILLIYLN